MPNVTRYICFTSHPQGGLVYEQTADAVAHLTTNPTHRILILSELVA